MKKSIHIKLMLITAALASCNRTIIPSVTPDIQEKDSSLVATPDFDPVEPDCYCEMDYDSTRNLYNYNRLVFYNWIFPQRATYYPGRFYRRDYKWRNHHFIVRGGFGKTAVAAAAS